MDPAIDEGDAAVGGGGNFGAVGDEDDGGFLLAGEPGDEFDDGGAGGGVEVARRFIGKENGGLMNEGAGEGGALKLAAGELVGSMMGPVGESDGGQQFLGTLAGLSVDSAGKEEGEKNVFLDGEGGKEMKKLENKSDFKTSEGGEFGVIQGMEGVAFEVSLAGGGGVEGSENVEEGAFTASARPGDGHNLPRQDFQGDPAEGVHLRIPRRIGLMKVTSFEHKEGQILYVDKL